MRPFVLFVDWKSLFPTCGEGGAQRRMGRWSSAKGDERKMVAIKTADVGDVGLARLEGTDRAPLLRFFFRLSPETPYRRFHTPIPPPDPTSPRLPLALA